MRRGRTAAGRVIYIAADGRTGYYVLDCSRSKVLPKLTGGRRYAVVQTTYTTYVGCPPFWADHEEINYYPTDRGARLEARFRSEGYGTILDS